MNFLSKASIPGRVRRKRSRAASKQNCWTSLPEYDNLITAMRKQISSITYNSTTQKRDYSTTPTSVMVGEQQSQSPSSSGVMRKCMHYTLEKTPQWRTGPLGPKALCNACGVRYKSGPSVTRAW
ncbi:hypothetical protein NE237_026351 [Protea cynaroides]|uniref:GATA-type domain-containing protein n=1 Tax=Protea cynaroides TaxID=273540 RepID=A0A9Q0K274_9MAGN|nr:hypothetical protein NE237_026351 [Protea cynaroides]